MTVRPQFPDESVDGAFVRQDDAFRGWVRADGPRRIAPEFGRYHLYVSWRARGRIARSSSASSKARRRDRDDRRRPDPRRPRLGVPRRSTDHGRRSGQRLRFLAEAYVASDPRYHGRVTVPVLWDTQTQSHRQQLRRRHHAHVRDGVRRAGAPRSRPVSRRAPRGDRRAQRRRSTSGQQRCLPGRLRGDPSGVRTAPPTASSSRSTRSTRGWRTAATCSAPRRSRPTGGCS